MELFKSRTRVAYTNAVGDKVYPVIVDIKRGIKSTEEIQFMSSDINTGILSVAFIQGNENYNVSGAEVVCSVMRPDASTLDIPCTIVENNIVEVPLGINGTSQDGIYSFDFKVFKGGNKVVGTPIMNYSVSLSISNDNAVLEDDRLPVLTMLMTQVTELKDEVREAINQANTATEATREATANAIEATTTANETINKVTQDTANAIAEVNATSDTMVENVNNAISSMDTTVNSQISEMTNTVNDKISEVNTVKNDMINEVSSTKANMVTEVNNAKNEMTTTVSNKIDEVENRFNALTSKQQQDAEVIDARVDFKGVAFDSLKERIDYTDKLLRDSTISTVTTESDFTTVEATSNGYFEDVKLEGKTLVNLWDIESISKSGETVVKNNRITVTTTSNIYSNFFYEQKSKFKPLTEYTIIADVYKNTLQSNDIVFITSNSGASFDNRDIFAVNGGTQFTITGGVVGRIVKKYTTTSDFSEADFALRSFVANNSQTEGGEFELVITVLEGDHTQNPPSYFEGLKSVGQSASNDGADEIVVSSVKGDGNLFDFSKLNGGEFTTLNGKNVYKYTDNASFYFYNGRFKKDTQYTITMTMFRDVGYETKGLNLQIEYTDGTSKNFSFTHSVTQTITSEQGKTIKKLSGSYNHGLKAYIDLDSICLNEGDVAINHQPHQTDKKRLLYYNNETQAWEKPILREWDSIEKHADGKYYYHQRSKEVVLNGSENWRNFTIETHSKRMNLRLTDVKTSSSLVSTINVIQWTDKPWETTVNTICCAMDYGLYLYLVNVSNEVDFKAWLQANNVTVVYQLAQEKVYECTNIDLITYANETNYIVESGAIAPKSILKVHNNISNVVKILQQKVSLLENKFIEGLKQVLAGDMYSLAELLYPEDFEEVETENNIMLLPLE